MQLPAFPMLEWQTFLLCLARVAAVIGSMPVFSGKQAPVRMRAGLAMAVAVLLYPVVREHIPEQSLQPVHLMIFMLNEILLGILLGFTARLIFTAAQFGGTVVGYQMGFAAANIIDPQSQQQIPLLSQFQNVLAILVFLAVNAHHVFFRALARSFEVIPPGQQELTGGAVPFLMQLAGDMFVLGVQLSAPIMAVLAISHFILGVMSRVFSQLNVFLLSFPINIGLALIMFGLTLDLVVALLNREFHALDERFVRILQLVS